MALCALLVVALAAGCAKGISEETGSDGGEGTYEENLSDAGFRRTVIYYPTDDGYIVPVMKLIPWEEGIGKAAISYLVDNEANNLSAALMGLRTSIPAGTTYTLRIGDDGVATLDLIGFTAHENAQDERNMVVSIVNTLTEFTAIESVKFKLDGKSVKKLPNGTKVSGALEAYALNVEDGAASVSTGGGYAMTLYFPNQSASLNVPVTRYCEGAPEFSAIVQALIDGPQSDALLAPFPEGTELLSAKVGEGMATIDLSAQFANIELTDGLYEACCEAIMLSANAMGHQVYELALSVEGEPYQPAVAVSAPIYANEFRS